MTKIPDQLIKAYKNTKFLNSPDARLIRMMAEYLEPFNRFRRYKIADTLVFFGSSRIRSSDSVRKDIEKLEKSSSQARQKNHKGLQSLK